MENRLTIAGFGGQGVMVIGQILCYTAIDCGKEALFLPQYGPEQRGGTANCKVILSDQEIGSPITKKMDTLIAMNSLSLQKFQSDVKAEGIIFINSSQCAESETRKDVRVFALPLDSLANEIGSGKVANMIVFGAFVRYCGFFTQEQAIASVKAKLDKRPQLFEMNQKAVICGFNMLTDMLEK
ncbi:2-oxoglutarate ferredoxin oxidoreductase subunit gamma [Synergistales bacterium]|nr:2-oxoglutarate ferredoxin oxidoreductase subunit gamma [Synergistales bacterium]